MKRGSLLVVLAGALGPLSLLYACDEPPKGGAGAASSAAQSAGSVTTAAPSTLPAASTAPTAQPSDAGARTPDDSGLSPWDGSMPPRPVPRTSPTVGSGMPAEVQMRAITYMAAMRAPHIDDPWPDQDWIKTFSERLATASRGIDHGPDKGTMNRVEIVGGGRQIDMLMSAGCDEKTPSRAAVSQSGTPLSTLYAHGVLVIRCNDARAQCLQSTRDATDVLCTTAPRHK